MSSGRGPGSVPVSAGRSASAPTTKGAAMSAHEALSGTTALVTGASRGFGRAIATALAKAGAEGRRRGPRAAAGWRSCASSSAPGSPRSSPTRPTRSSPAQLHRPVPARASWCWPPGPSPLSRPLHQHTWETFSRNWDVDVQQVFHWTREALLRPLEPGSMVIAFSSGAALARLAAVRRLRRGQGDDQVHRRLRRGRVRAGGPGHPVRRGAPAADPGHRPGRGRGGRLRAAGGRGRPPPTWRSPARALTPEQVGKAIVALATDPGP